MEKYAYAQENYAPPPREGSILQLPIEQIYTEKGKNKPLKRNECIRLAQNIRRYGVSTPVVVTPIEAFPGFYRYHIQKGAEIWQAACIAGVKTLPCVIENAPQRPPEVAELLAQIRTGGLDIFTQAAAIRYLVEKCALSRAEIAAESGFSPSAIANKLRLCRLSPAEQKEILLAGLSERHARAILRLKEPEKRLAALRVVIREKMTVAAAESLVEAILLEEVGENPRLGSQIQPQDPPLEAPKPLPKTSKSPSEAQESHTEGEDKPPEVPANVTEALGSMLPAPSARKIPARKPATGSICPKKFALHTLQPLYNSLERTLSIFRKTGRTAEMRTQEGENGVLITIHIPQ